MSLFTDTHHHTSYRKPLFSGVFRALAVWRQRRALERLDDAALRDLGLTRSQVEEEARRTLWDAPETWRC